MNMALGSTIKKLREAAGLTQTQLAQMAGMEQQALAALEKRDSKSSSFAPGLAAALGKSTDELLGIQKALNKTADLRIEKRSIDEVDPAPNIIGMIRDLPVLGKVQAGPDGLLIIDDYPVGFGDGTVQYWAACDNAYALRVRGESMSPRYLPGEFVAVDPCSEVQPSQEVIVLQTDGTRMIKRLLWMRDAQACFESINKDYKNITLGMDEITALHRVLGRVPPEAFKPSH